MGIKKYTFKPHIVYIFRSQIHILKHCPRHFYVHLYKDFCEHYTDRYKHKYTQTGSNNSVCNIVIISMDA